jgi:hypothetical protein
MMYRRLPAPIYAKEQRRVLLARQHDYLPLKHLNYASNATDYAMIEDVTSI